MREPHRMRNRMVARRRKAAFGSKRRRTGKGGVGMGKAERDGIAEQSRCAMPARDAPTREPINEKIMPLPAMS